MGKENKRMNGLFMNMLSSRYADFLGHNLDFVENGGEETRMDYIPMPGLISEVMNIRFDFDWLSEEDRRLCYGEIFEEFNETTKNEMLTLKGYVDYLRLILNAFNKKFAKTIDLSPAIINVKNARLGDNRPFAVVGDNAKNKITIYVDFANNKIDIPEYNMAFLITLIKCNLNLLYMEYLKLSNIGTPTVVEYSDVDAFVASCIATKACLNIAFSRRNIDKGKLGYNEACAPDDLFLEKLSIEACRNMLIENGLAHTEIAVMLKEYAEKVSELLFDAVRNYSINNLKMYDDFNEQGLVYSVRDEKNGALYLMNQPLIAYRVIRKNGLPKLLKELGFSYDTSKFKSPKDIDEYMKTNNSCYAKNKKGMANFWGDEIVLRQVSVSFPDDFAEISDEEDFSDEEEFE